MKARIRSAREMRRGGGEGTGMSSLRFGTPGLPAFSLCMSSCLNRVFFADLPLPLRRVRSGCELSSRDGRSLIRSGSSSSASWSTRSPVSLQRENSDSLRESLLPNEERRLSRFSLGDSISDAESESCGRCAADRVWSGIVGFCCALDEAKGGMFAVAWAEKSSPRLQAAGGVCGGGLLDWRCAERAGSQACPRCRVTYWGLC
jgi:hypothetical protein